MLDTKLFFGQIKCTDDKTVIIKVTSQLITHIASRFFCIHKDELSLYLCGKFTGGLLQNIYLSKDYKDAFRFVNFDRAFFKLIPEIIRQSLTPMTPTIAQVANLEISGYSGFVILPVKGAPRGWLEAWYVQPHLWTLDKRNATVYETQVQVRRVLNGQDPEVFVQPNLLRLSLF